MVNSLGKSVVWLIILADLIVGRQAHGHGRQLHLPAQLQGQGWGQGRALPAAAAAAAACRLLLPSRFNLRSSHSATPQPLNPPMCSSGDGSGLLPELLRAAGYPAAASGGAWYLRRWPWILLLTVLATPAVSGKALPAALGGPARHS